MDTRHLSSSIRLGHVAELWRYPIKSMAGQPCVSLTLDPGGVAGDRRYALRSAEAPVGAPLLSSAQRSTLIPRQPPPLTDPHLRSSLVTLLPEASSLELLHNSAKPFTDVRPIALHSLATIAQLSQELGRPFDPRRLRSNIVLDLAGQPPFAEDTLAGRTLRLGSTATIRLLERIPRCRIVSLHPDTAEPDRTLLTHLAHSHQGRAGIYAATLSPGTIHLGDPIHLEP